MIETRRKNAKPGKNPEGEKAGPERARPEKTKPGSRGENRALTRSGSQW
jgi:hypothetical protein